MRDQDVPTVEWPAEPAKRCVAVAGASGLIGTALVAALRAADCDVLRLVRRPPTTSDEVAWDPAHGTLDDERLEGIDGIVNLAGRGIADGRWTASVRTELYDSRVKSAALIARALAGLDRPPRVWVNASAVGYYGDRGTERLDEASAAGSGFLATLCEAWESAVEAPPVVRVVRARFGIVLSPAGGALAKMLPPFRWGLGGRIGGGRQYMSWIGLGDAVRAIAHVLGDSTITGPVNIVAPTPVTNGEFTATLGRVLHRPAPFVLPAALMSLVLGEMGRETVLAGNYVLPRALEQSGFVFGHPQLEQALRHEMGCTPPGGD